MADSIIARFDEFKRAVAEDAAAEPLVLNSDGINVLISHHPDWSEERLRQAVARRLAHDSG